MTVEWREGAYLKWKEQQEKRVEVGKAQDVGISKNLVSMGIEFVEGSSGRI